ncbi:MULTISPECIES: RNA-binding protein [Methanobacterium]|jgi:tRNA acetyltransferase TAN1|uniref:RNA-binding protein n=1 Tax=Methanobacterium subterraneum TaxID=59277 RepID=A0A2H4VEB4_9EURY|nr:MULTISPECIES: RNA-binding protein [Methanobacterium]MBW4257386.1 RNA-binding protein [Methanobacterium sp. YSL]PKL73027.1 MAG: RNA-binding protein [Methanobacteriales archaeon HGW-Methanobacteriales-2]AUB56438.1 hypothetical protein BK007_10720 [Methanobacterium subterraneum]AUB58692.1 hypothetical protein BK008_10470 [Methanobacterium sp. MZ-A1]NMO09049.1 RNA-binding protein [Methanobacterium subterraneum]
MKENQKIEKRENKSVILVKFENNEKFENNGFKEINPEIKGKKELKKVMEAMGIWFYIMESEFYDTVTVEMDEKPLPVIKQFRQTPTTAIKRIIPLDSVVSSASDELITTILELASVKINKEESFTLRLSSNGSKLRGIKFPEKITSRICTELCNGLKLQYHDNLRYHDENTNWIIQIEELGENKGISICRPDEILMK